MLGYSDHTLGNDAAILATTYGAEVIEKHFTLSKNLIGPDHLMSSDPKEFKQLTDMIKKIKLLEGSGDLKPKKDEQKLKTKYRRSITCISKMNKGDIFSKKNISLMRPANGLHPKFYKKILGTKSKKNIKNGKKIQFSDLLVSIN